MHYQMAKRAPGAKVIVPAVVNWKAGHFAALVKEQDERFQVQDPTFGDDIWVTQAALCRMAGSPSMTPKAKWYWAKAMWEARTQTQLNRATLSVAAMVARRKE